MKSALTSRNLAAALFALALLGAASAPAQPFDPSIASRSASPAAASAAASSIYWGAYEEGPNTYGHLYGGTWTTAPFDCRDSTPPCATQNAFASHAGKEPSIIHWGAGAPWDHDFNYWVGTLNLAQRRGDLNLLDLQSRSVKLSDIAHGSYDSAFATWAKQARAWGHPFFLRWDWEMNGSWFPWGTTSSNQNTAADYVAAWRHIHDIFRRAKATNVTWVWCPNVDPRGMFTPYKQLFPGKKYVDWTCMDGYNQDGTSSFAWLFGASYNQLLHIASKKPIMIAETSSIEGGAGKAAWITDALSVQLPKTFPRIKALVWFNFRISEYGGWWDWEIESSAASQAAFQAAIGSNRYAPGGGLGSLPLHHTIAPLPPA